MRTASPFLATLGRLAEVASTVPESGDLNPYGIAVVPSTVGRLRRGDTLVSNFNDKANVQGTGRSIVEVSPHGAVSTFATIASLRGPASCPGGTGLTAALSILPGGWVVVGSLASGPGGALPRVNPAGCIYVLNSKGKVKETWSSENIDGPWVMAETRTASGADLFVSNVLTRPRGTDVTPPSGLCTIVRISISFPANRAPRMTGSTVIGTGFVWEVNEAVFAEGASGVALGHDGTLYVAEPIDSHITRIPDAMSRTTAVADGSNTLSSGGWLNGPLGVTMAPNGDVIATNGNDGDAVEISPRGRQVAELALVRDGAGDLFGVTIAPGGHGLLFVNDGTNALDRATSR